MPRLNGWRRTIAPSASACGDGRVDRAVVDDEDVEVGRLALDVADDAADHPLLVVGGDDRELAGADLVRAISAARAVGARSAPRPSRGTAPPARATVAAFASAIRSASRRSLDGLRKALDRSRAGGRLRGDQRYRSDLGFRGRASLRATMSPAPRAIGAEAFDRLEREITGCRALPAAGRLAGGGGRRPAEALPR